MQQVQAITIPPPWTAIHNSPNRSRRQPVGRHGVVLHYAVTTSLDALRRLVMGAKQVSATAIVKDDQRELIVPNPQDRPWSLSSAWGDSAFRSIECANESSNGWTISEASNVSMALCVAYWATVDGFWPHRDGADRKRWTVVGHGEMKPIWGVSYATACPGSLPLDHVTRMAQDFLTGARPLPGTDPAPQPNEPEEVNMSTTTYIERVDARGSHDGEWMIVDRELGPELDDDGHPITFVGQDGEVRVRQGFRVTTNWDLASLWQVLYGIGQDRLPVKLPRAAYIRIQDYAIADAQAHERYLLSIAGRTGTEPTA